MIEQFKADVLKGLSATPKSLPSKYFYDEKGDALFVEIMNMPEYYLTNCEYEIFNEKTDELIQALELNSSTYFELIELGAGDGTKTKRLLHQLVDQKYNFQYFPIDISSHALDDLQQSLTQEIPSLEVHTRQGDYFEVLSTFKDSPHPKVVLFLGSNIGNLNDELSAQFIYQLGENLHPNDFVLLGVDLIKPSSIVLPAYNDAKGITSAFNLNLLERMNRELGADFDITQFEHHPQYNEETGIAESGLKSIKYQEVNIKQLDKKFKFKSGEIIHTEISRKYNDEILNTILHNTDFKIESKITDSKNYFANYCLKRY